jgi:coenzyme F420-reducing hydrogenase beta subunit
MGYTATTNIPEVIGGQDGGTVTSILSYLFDEHLIDAAVVTMKDPNKPWHPIAKIIATDIRQNFFIGLASFTECEHLPIL